MSLTEKVWFACVEAVGREQVGKREERLDIEEEEEEVGKKEERLDIEEEEEEEKLVTKEEEELVMLSL